MIGQQIQHQNQFGRQDDLAQGLVTFVGGDIIRADCLYKRKAALSERYLPVAKDGWRVHMNVGYRAPCSPHPVRATPPVQQNSGRSVRKQGDAAHSATNTADPTLAKELCFFMPCD
jgi:hypothetical protein